MVAVTPPDFDHDAGFLSAAEPFERRALIAESSVEALVGPVLPRLSRIIECGVDLRVAEPFEDCVADEFRARCPSAGIEARRARRSGV